MVNFCSKYMKRIEPLTILDLGSLEVGNGTYRNIFAWHGWKYFGLDIVPGENVDIVLHDPYSWTEVMSESADVVISGQTLEHVEFPWRTMQEIARVLKPGGVCCIIVPSTGPEHRYPFDCWRFLSDGLDALARYAGLKVLEISVQKEDLPQYNDWSNKWRDAVLIAQKPIKGLTV